MKTSIEHYETAVSRCVISKVEMDHPLPRFRSGASALPSHHSRSQHGSKHHEHDTYILNAPRSLKRLSQLVLDMFFCVFFSFFLYGILLFLIMSFQISIRNLPTYPQHDPEHPLTYQSKISWTSRWIEHSSTQVYAYMYECTCKQVIMKTHIQKPIAYCYLTTLLYKQLQSCVNPRNKLHTTFSMPRFLSRLHIESEIPGDHAGELHG